MERELEADTAKKPLKIVHFTAPGLSRTKQENFAVRSHVRVAVLQAKKASPPCLHVKFIDHIESRNRRRRRKEGDFLAPDADVLPVAAGRHWRNDKSLASLTLALPSSHPFANMAAKFIRLPTDRLQHLFKSEAFRFAAEPIFDTGHVDANLNMLSVFPGCESDAVFFYALVFSIIKIANRGRVTEEALQLQGHTLRLLNDRLGAETPILPASTVGAVMLLRCLAYKLEDPQSHRVHSYGLSRLLQGCNMKLTAAAHRAVFWLDLSSTVLNFDSSPTVEDLNTASKIEWPLDRFSRLAAVFPLGFARHGSAIPDCIMECISDIVQLQSLLRSGILNHTSRDQKHQRLDSMQASIEHRLIFQGRVYPYSALVEGVRLCLYMICYFSWNETWGSTLVPCRVADQLFDLVSASLDHTDGGLWSYPLDIMLWFLLVGSSVTERDQGLVFGLREKRDIILSVVYEQLGFSISHDLSSFLKETLRDFIYCDEWLRDRTKVSAWARLEMLLVNSHNKDIGVYANRLDSAELLSGADS